MLLLTLLLCTSIFPFKRTLIRSLPDDPGFAHPDIRYFMLLIRCSMGRTCCKELEFLSTHSGILIFFFIAIVSVVFWFFLYCIQLPFHFLFICYHCVRHYIYYCSDFSAFIDDYIPHLDYFRLSVYTWSIFLVYLRRRLSSRLRFDVFLESRAWHWSRRKEGRQSTWIRAQRADKIERKRRCSGLRD